MSQPGHSGVDSFPVNGLFVAAYGSGSDRGLYRFLLVDGRWRGQLLAGVHELTALAAHPSRPVIYGVSGAGAGLVHAWDVSGENTQTLSELTTGGIEPCHVAVSPNGRLLLVTNYESGELATWQLAADGSLSGEAQLVRLAGSGSDAERQLSSHPHQATFAGDLVYVVDLGADVVRIFKVSERGVTIALTPLGEVTTPANTGPRHLVILPSGNVALSGELGCTVLTGRLDGPAPEWQESPSTRRTRRADQLPNYPGDIQRSPDGQFVYVAVRGCDTVASFAVGDGALRPIDERDSSVRWPQHLLIIGDTLVVAGRDSSVVVALPIHEGSLGEPKSLFECPGAAWLLPVKVESRA